MRPLTCYNRSTSSSSIASAAHKCSSGSQIRSSPLSSTLSNLSSVPSRGLLPPATLQFLPLRPAAAEEASLTASQSLPGAASPGRVGFQDRPFLKAKQGPEPTAKNTVLHPSDWMASCLSMGSRCLMKKHHFSYVLHSSRLSLVN